MDRTRALYVGLCAAIVAFAAAFVWPAVSPFTLLWYYPLEHRWAFELKPSGLAMDFYGRTLVASGIALVVFAAGRALARRYRHPVSGGFALWAGAAGAAVVLALGFYVWHLAPRSPVPVPLPASYVPK